jgi:hypothetical protein
MPHTSSLLLTTAPAYQSGRIDPGDLPAGVPPELPAGGPLLSYGLLLGEILGVDTAEAVDTLAVATRATALRRQTDEDAERLLFGDDLPVLRDTFAAIEKAAAPAIDGDSRPAGPAGERIARSEHVALDEHGQAFIGSRALRIGDLVDRLPELVRMLDAAAQRALLVVLR